MTAKPKPTYLCPSCANTFAQPFVCTTCGAQKLHDATLDALRNSLAAANRRLAELQKLLHTARERIAELEGRGMSDPCDETDELAAAALAPEPEPEPKAVAWMKPISGDVISALEKHQLHATKFCIPLFTHPPDTLALLRDAARWNALPAFLEKYQINYVGLLCDIDTALKEAGE